MEKKYLFVPIHLDALLLEKDQNVVQAQMDFSRTPYFDPIRGYDQNSKHPYLSEHLLSTPFQNQQLQLKAGLHLHWALPDTLTKGVQTEEGTIVFPPVPNRWLVQRLNKAGSVDRNWIIESDYLYPEGNSYQAVVMPIQSDRGHQQRHRYMGRKLSYQAWLNKDKHGQTNQYFEELTAIGYGELSFAAFYPNCYSVFGFWDGEFKSDIYQGYSYEVLGWYENPLQDPLQQLEGKPNKWEILQDKLKWTLDEAAVMQEANFPESTLFFSRISLSKPRSDPNPDSTPLSCAIGNTGTEALAAYLAQTIKQGITDQQLEDQLNFIALSEHLSKQRFDIGPKFREIKHESGFSSFRSGQRWNIKLINKDQGNSEEKSNRQEFILSEALAFNLNQLNIHQQSFNQVQQKIEALEQQLFIDWYKYMICAYPPNFDRLAYPDVDLVRHFIEKKDLAPLEQLIQKKNKIDNLVDQAKQAVVQEIEVFKNTSPPQNYDLELRVEESARYWRPNDPTILIVGEAARPSTRHGQDGRQADGLLACSLRSQAAENLNFLEQLHHFIQDSSHSLLTHFNITATSLSDTHSKTIAFSNWEHNPWNPIILEWQLQAFPLKHGSNSSPTAPGFAVDFITNSFELKKQANDLSVKKGQGSVQISGDIYTGFSYLSTGARDILEDRIDQYLLQKQTQQTTDAATANIKIAKQILDDNFYALAQRLGGLHEALIMRKISPQLAMEEPIGLAAYQAFTGQLASVLAGDQPNAPIPLNHFMPIRTGILKINQLRLVDSFGQVKYIDVNTPIRPAELQVKGSRTLFQLPPRIAQAARINFRWLSAKSAWQEMTNHTLSSPICGWVVVNVLEESLYIFDQSGKALGILNSESKWAAIPGQEKRTAIKEIPNVYLRKMVAYLDKKEVSQLEDFIRSLVLALQNINPNTNPQGSALSLLMSQPLALVRAFLNLELLGTPAIDQSWTSFRQDLQRSRRSSDGFERVRFPIRLGEYRQLNDGIAGYWIEGPDHTLLEDYYAPQDDYEQQDWILSHYDQNSPILQAFADAPTYLSMLVDPRAKMHATTGILPTKIIDIPARYYLDAIQTIELSFLAAPILTEQTSIRLPFAPVENYGWSWLQKISQTIPSWQETSTTGFISEKQLSSLLGEQMEEGLWQQLINKQWIEEIEEGNKAKICPQIISKEGQNLDLSNPNLQAIIEEILQQQYLSNSQTKAILPKRTIIREGWLQLKKTEPSKS